MTSYRPPDCTIAPLTHDREHPYIPLANAEGTLASDEQPTERHGEPEWLTTGDMARLSGTTLRTVRFYEAEGLIRAMARGDGTHRRFAGSELRKLQIISDLRESGLSLREIKILFGLKSRHASAKGAAGQATELLSDQIEAIDRKIATLRRARAEVLSTVDTLRRCAGCVEPGFPERCSSCGVIEPSDSLTALVLWKN